MDCRHETGAKIAALRKKKKLTPEDLANRMFVSTSVIAHLEAGTVRPCRETVQRLAKALNTALPLPEDPRTDTADSGICIAVDPRPDALRETLRVWDKMLPDAECYGFLSGEDARSFFLNHPAGLVFLEISLGSFSGLELAREMTLLHPRTNICFLTGQADYVGEAWQLHATDYVLKPLTEAKLRNTLTHLRFPSVLNAAKIG